MKIKSNLSFAVGLTLVASCTAASLGISLYRMNEDSKLSNAFTKAGVSDPDIQSAIKGALQGPKRDCTVLNPSIVDDCDKVKAEAVTQGWNFV